MIGVESVPGEVSVHDKATSDKILCESCVFYALAFKPIKVDA